MPAEWLCRKVFQDCDLPRPPPRHVLGDGRLRDLDPELQQFTMDAGRSP